MLAVCMAAAFAAAHVAAGAPALVPMPREIDATGGECVLTRPPVIEVDGSVPAEGYRLSVTPDGVTIRHSDAAGLIVTQK